MVDQCTTSVVPLSHATSEDLAAACGVPNNALREVHQVLHTEPISFGLCNSSAAVVSNALAGYWVGSALLSLEEHQREVSGFLSARFVSALRGGTYGGLSGEKLLLR